MGRKRNGERKKEVTRGREGEGRNVRRRRGRRKDHWEERRAERKGQGKGPRKKKGHSINTGGRGVGREG